MNLKTHKDPSRILKERCIRNVKLLQTVQEADSATDHAGYRKRLSQELDEISTRGLSETFLALGDVVQEIRKAGMGIGTGRFRTGSSLVAHLLGLTPLDPVEHDLHFPLLWSVKDGRIPWLPISISCLEQPAVMDLIRDRYGAECTSLFISRPNPDRPDRWSVVPGALALSSEPIHRHVSTFSFHGQQCAMATRHELEDLGMVCLWPIPSRQATLMNALDEMLRDQPLVAPRHSAKPDGRWDVRKMFEADHEEVYPLVSRPVWKLLKDVRPESFDELVDLLSFHPPDPATNGLLRAYLEPDRPSPMRNKIPKIAPFLIDTRGLLLFEEQILRIVMHFGGLEKSTVAEVWFAVQSGETACLCHWRQEFVVAAVSNGLDSRVATEVFDFFREARNHLRSRAESVAKATDLWRVLSFRGEQPQEYRNLHLNVMDAVQNSEFRI